MKIKKKQNTKNFVIKKLTFLKNYTILYTKCFVLRINSWILGGIKMKKDSVLRPTEAELEILHILWKLLDNLEGEKKWTL